MTTRTTPTPGPRNSTDDTRDDRAGTGSTDRGSASPAVVPATGRPGDPARRGVAVQVLVGLVAATAVLALVLLVPGLLAALAISAGLVAIGSFALVASSPWLLLGVVAVIALVIATRHSSHPRSASR
jgi:hypothetical protein